MKRRILKEGERYRNDDIELLKNVYEDAQFVSYYGHDTYKVKFNCPSEKELKDKLKEAGKRVPEGFKVDTKEDPRIYRWSNGTYDGNLWLKKPKSKK